MAVLVTEAPAVQGLAGPASELVLAQLLAVYLAPSQPDLAQPSCKALTLDTFISSTFPVRFHDPR